MRLFACLRFVSLVVRPGDCNAGAVDGDMTTSGAGSSCDPGSATENHAGVFTLGDSTKPDLSRVLAALQNDDPKELNDLHDADGRLLGVLEWLEQLYGDPLFGVAKRAKSREGRQQADAEGHEVLGETRAVTYGEVDSRSFLQMLQHVGARPGMRFYDLGSGMGRTVILAWILGLDATGVELVSPRWSVACEVLRKLKKTALRPHEPARMRHIHASFMDVDFSDADIVFVNSVMFSQQMVDDLAKFMRLRPGSVVVSHRHPSFPKDVGLKYVEKILMATSWKNDTTWNVHTPTLGVAHEAVDVSRRRRSKADESCELSQDDF